MTPVLKIVAGEEPLVAIKTCLGDLPTFDRSADGAGGLFEVTAITKAATVEEGPYLREARGEL